jgi:hypothetical protein
MEIVGKPGSYALSAFYDDEYDAEAASQKLLDAGIPKKALTLTPGNRPDTTPVDRMGFLDALTGIFFNEQQRTAYAEALERGGTLLTVEEVSQAQHDVALKILMERGRIETDERSEEWRSAISE